MISVFYCEKKGKGFILEKNEIHHIKVLRKTLPTEILFTDGNGILYSGICEKDYTIKKYKIIEKSKNNEFVNVFFGICDKNRIKIILEKSTELGVKAFFPIITEKSSKYSLNQERAKNILKSAVKQSRRYYIPEYNEPVEIFNIDKKYFKNAYFGSIINNNKKIEISNKNEMNIFIGPPSGFIEKEEEFLISNGVKPFYLDSAILRTETFVISFLSIIHYLKGVGNG